MPNDDLQDELETERGRSAESNEFVYVYYIYCVRCSEFRMMD